MKIETKHLKISRVDSIPKAAGGNGQGRGFAGTPRGTGVTQDDAIGRVA
ncbi:MAG: hypothetical protein ACPG4Q_08330 [Phycisphaeraceae bacterium]